MRRTACIILVFVSSCVSHELPLAVSCNLTNPVQDLPWLQAEVDDLNSSELGRKYWFITEATYKLQTVFIIKNCCPMCDTLPPPVYACNGELLFRGSDEQFKDIRNERLIWKSTEYACTF